MYVAATRAAFWLGCSGYWWGEGGSCRLGPSPFLEEVRSSGVATISEWAAEPAPDAENPLLATVDEADWPATPAGLVHEAVREAAALVEAGTEPDITEIGPEDQPLVEAWRRDAELLLAERALRRADGGLHPGPAARPAVGVFAGLAGPGPGRAGPAGPPADAACRLPGRPGRAPLSTSGWSSGTASSG